MASMTHVEHGEIWGFEERGTLEASPDSAWKRRSSRPSHWRASPGRNGEEQSSGGTVLALDAPAGVTGRPSTASSRRSLTPSPRSSHAVLLFVRDGKHQGNCCCLWSSIGGFPYSDWCGFVYMCDTSWATTCLRKSF
ncbi:hypothetical protein PAHAL_6G006000 [Panicum hallii]|uniref:Uncharacterized protein n=1 Tax=Panicum hallii TaxID=206008 RepID=A0A2T8IEN1_9POAL|nr:hypothetical protein PAHAL_6G006000 [Panicum hallii]